ncbi:MAG: hypothetical protein ACN6N0_14700, partial [Microvirgula sp.]
MTLRLWITLFSLLLHRLELVVNMWAKWPEAVIHLWTVLAACGDPVLSTGAEAVGGRFVHMPESARDEYNAGHEP